MITCPHCGRTVPPQMRFCPHCGGRIDVEFEQIREKLAAEKRREEAEEKERRARKIFFACLFILIVVLSLFAAVPKGRVSFTIYPVYYAKPPRLPVDKPARWLTKDPAEIPKGKGAILSVPSD